DYYEIQINPQNLVFDTQYDGYNAPNGNGRGPFGHEEWSANLTSAVVVRGTLDDDSDVDQGYTVEAKIPWASFTKAQHAPPLPGHVGGDNLLRKENQGGRGVSPPRGGGHLPPPPPLGAGARAPPRPEYTSRRALKRPSCA